MSKKLFHGINSISLAWFYQIHKPIGLNLLKRINNEELQKYLLLTTTYNDPTFFVYAHGVSACKLDVFTIFPSPCTDINVFSYRCAIAEWLKAPRQIWYYNFFGRLSRMGWMILVLFFFEYSMPFFCKSLLFVRK